MNLIKKDEIYSYCIYRKVSLNEYCNYFDMQRVLDILAGKRHPSFNTLTEDFILDTEIRKHYDYNYSRMYEVHQRKLSQNGKTLVFDAEKKKFSIETKTSTERYTLFTNRMDFHYLSCPFCKKPSEEVDFLIPKHNKTIDDVLKEEQDNLIIHSFKNNVFGLPKTMIFDTITTFFETKYKRHFLDIFENEDGHFIYRCPSCYKIFGKNLSNGSVCMFNDFDVTVLRRDSDWMYNNKIPMRYDIYSDENSPMVVLSVTNKHLLPNLNGSIHFVYGVDRITFNTKTGQTYSFGEKALKDKKPLDNWSPSIVNMTYQEYPFSSIKLTDEMFFELAKEICKKKNLSFDFAHLEADNFCRNEKIQMLCLLNRYGDNFDKNFLEIASYDFNKKILKSIARMKDDYLKYGKFLKKCGIRGKILKKMCFQNPYIAFLYMRFSSIGLTNIDCMCKHFANPEMFSKQKLRFLSLNSVLHGDNWDNQIGLKDFVRDYCSVRPEKDFFESFMLVRENDLLYDLLYMYNKAKIRKLIPKKVDDLKKVFKGNFRQIHDRLFLVLEQAKTREFFIPYEKEELSVCGKIGDYSFVLAKSSEELTNAGQKMHICVGSYDDKAFSKKCNIVFMLDSQQEFAACIELQKNVHEKYELFQAKDFCNGRLTQEKKPALVKWLIENEIDFQDCYDSRSNALKEVCPSNEIFERTADEIIGEYKVFETKELFEKIFLRENSINWDITPTEPVTNNRYIPFN